MRERTYGAAWPGVLFLLSGAAALGLQMVWVRMFTAGLGHEMPAVIGVTGAFLGGMAAGAWFLDQRISRSTRPSRWYGGLELVVAGWSALTALLIPSINRLALSLAGTEPEPWRQWLVVFLLPFLALLPATAAMGASLPAMDRWLAAWRNDGRCIGMVYAWNTLGAVAGTLGSVFVLMPALGFRNSLLCLATVSAVCGLSSWRVQSCGEGANRKIDDLLTRDSASVSQRRLHITIFLTGLFAIGYEIAGVRALSQVLENTVYTYAAVLAVWLMGTAGGAALYQRLGRRRTFVDLLGGLLWAVSVSCLAGIHLLRLARPFYEMCRGSLGDSTGAVLLSEMLVAAMLFGAPPAFMGALFSHLVQGARRAEGGVGRAAAWNTLGCALAAVVTGVVLISGAGAVRTLALVSLGYLLLLPRFKGWSVAGVLCAAALMGSLPDGPGLVARPAGAKVREHREGVMATVEVLEMPDGNRSLRVNHRLQMGGTAAALAQRRQTHIPLLLHPKPERALFLGPGTGITLGAAGAHPQLVSVGVELVPEVLEVMRHFEPENGGPFPKPNIRVRAADARRFVRTTTNRFDVVVADVFHPAQDGAGFLYTREHFEAVRGCLKPGGVFCQWLPLHQLDEPVLRSIIATFLDVFPRTHAVLLHFNVDIPVLALVGEADGWRLSAEVFDRRLENAELRGALRQAGLERFVNLAGCFVAGPEALKSFSAGAAVGTDDRPVVLFAAPFFGVRRDAQPHKVLLSLLEKVRGGRSEWEATVAGGDEVLQTQLNDFVEARDVYLRGLVEEGAGRLGPAIDAYLESARRSLLFTPGYARCVTIIQVMANTDRARAKDLFRRLEEAQPAQPLGRRMLGPLFE